jgi:hypothetical protein
VIAVLLVVVGPVITGSTTTSSTAAALVELLMIGVRMPETCQAVNKYQVINWRNCCISLVIYLNCMMMHGLINFKSSV